MSKEEEESKRYSRITKEWKADSQTPLTKRVIAQHWQEIRADLSLGYNAVYWAHREDPCFSIHSTPDDWHNFIKENENEKRQDRHLVTFHAPYEPRVVFVTKNIAGRIQDGANGVFIRESIDEKAYQLILSQYIDE